MRPTTRQFRTFSSLAVSSLALLAMLAAGGCRTTRTVTREGSPRVSGRATVVEVNPRLGMAVVSMRGREFNVYWKPEVTIAHGGSVAPPETMFDSPVGVYNEPTVYPTAFPGHVGDTIEFLGMRSGDDILLQRVSVVGSK
jgi:hypothetical protein